MKSTVDDGVNARVRKVVESISVCSERNFRMNLRCQWRQWFRTVAVKWTNGGRSMCALLSYNLDNIISTSFFAHVVENLFKVAQWYCFFVIFFWSRFHSTTTTMSGKWSFSPCFPCFESNNSTFFFYSRRCRCFFLFVVESWVKSCPELCDWWRRIVVVKKSIFGSLPMLMWKFERGRKKTRFLSLWFWVQLSFCFESETLIQTPFAKKCVSISFVSYYCRSGKLFTLFSTQIWLWMNRM